MAGGASCFPCLLPIKKAISPSFNIVHRLHMRQLRGSLRPTVRTYPVCRSLFGKIPGRLGIPLKNIVDTSSLLDDGHVFLGFSKDGQFVLSYTLVVDADDHTSFPVYVYRLFWWRFRDNQPMYKVSEVRLFNEEEIQQDLYIALCSWPTDSSKVLVYGCCTSSRPRSEEKLMCYVTITAVPSLTPCPKCLHLKYSTDSEYMSHGEPMVPPEFVDDLSVTSGAAAPPCCLQHSFAVHTKYELSPPFPSFSPKHSLAKDGVVVLNTGDSILALAVNVGDCDLPSGSLYSPLLTPSRGSSAHRPGSVHGAGLPNHTGGPAAEADSDWPSESVGYPQQIERHSRALAAMDLDSYQLCDEWDYPESSPAMFLQDSDIEEEEDGDDKPAVTDDNDDNDEDRTLQDLSAGPNACTCNGGHSGRWTDGASPGECGINQAATEPSPADWRSPTKHPDPSLAATLPEIQVTSHSPGLECRIAGATVPPESLPAAEAAGGGRCDGCCSRKQPHRGRGGRHGGQWNQSEQSPASAHGDPSYSNSSKTNTNAASSSGGGGSDRSGPASNCLAGPYMNWSSPLRSGGYTVSDRGSMCGDDGQLGSEIEQHCPYHQGGGTQTSQRTMQECTCKLQGFTYSVRRYVERASYHDYLQTLEPDTFDYHSMVPLVVCGTQKSPMVITNRSPVNEGYHVEVKQLTMDAEHYLCVTIRTYAPWAERFISFTDYDMQILDVCGDSCSVVVMVIALIRAWPEPKAPRDVFEFDDDPANETPKLYETSFKFSWNLRTGQYETVEVGDLKEFNQAALCKTWNPGRVLCQRLQRDWAVPQNHTRGVHVLTNEAVFKNKSLRKLLDPVHYVAIVLT